MKWDWVISLSQFPEVEQSVVSKGFNVMSKTTFVINEKNCNNNISYTLDITSLETNDFKASKQEEV